MNNSKNDNKGISSGHPDGARVAFADGSMHFLGDATGKKTLLNIDNGNPKDEHY